MADISISSVNNINTAPAPVIRNNAAGDTKSSAGAQAAEKAREAAEAQKERSAEIRREQLEDVIAVSKDGDTVQATDESMERLAEDSFGHMEVRQDQNQAQAQNQVQAQNQTQTQDQAQNQIQTQDQTQTGQVTEEAISRSSQTAIEGTESRQAIEESIDKARTNTSRTEEAISQSVDRTVNGESRTEQAIEAGNKKADEEEAEEEYLQKLSSYQGISDMRLEQMYLQGEISKTDYDQEMESRKEEREAESEEDAAFENKMTGAAVLMDGAQRDLDQITTAFSDEANNTISAEDRMEIIETLDAQNAQNFNLQGAPDVVTDENASGEESVKKIVFS